MKAYGKIIAAEEKRSGVSPRTGNPWSSQIFVLETIEQYPKKIPFEVSGMNLEKFNLQIGETLTIDFDVDGSEYNGRWYPKIRCFNVSRGEAQQAAAAAPAPQPQADPAPQAPADPLAPDTAPSDSDNLPF